MMDNTESQQKFDAQEEVLSALEQQLGDYRGMQQVSLEQGQFITREDVTGLSSSFERMHRIMDRIRLRQQELPSGSLARRLESGDARIAECLEAIRHIIRDLQRSRQAHERSVRLLMERTQSELVGLGQGQRAARGYRGRFVEDARFFDGIR